MRKKYDQADETVLVKGCIKQHPAAQRVLYERFSSLMMGVCYRYARNRTDAEDMLQEGFIKVFNNIGQYRHEGSLEGWIRRIMVTSAINFLNRNKYLRLNIDMDQAGEVMVEPPNTEKLHDTELMQLLHQLPVGYKTIMNLYAIEGYSHREIGTMLNIAESTSRSQYMRARKLLMGLMDKQTGYRVVDK